MPRRPFSSIAAALLPALLLVGLPSRAQHRVLEPTGPSYAGSRVALVLGNAAYRNPRVLPPLRNSVNDANDVSAALRRLGFTVIVGTDLTLEQMRGALDAFTLRAQNAEVALFFYAGHGRSWQGENYLIPVEANLISESRLEWDALRLGMVMSDIENSGSDFKLIILDACRTNFVGSQRSGDYSGWAQASHPPTGSLIVYATSPGSTADDNPTGRNGLFTSHFLALLETNALEARQLFTAVQARVYDRSGHSQFPRMDNGYVGDYYFLEPDDDIDSDVTIVDTEGYSSDDYYSDYDTTIVMEPAPMPEPMPADTMMAPADTAMASPGYYYYSDADTLAWDDTTMVLDPAPMPMPADTMMAPAEPHYQSAIRSDMRNGGTSGAAGISVTMPSVNLFEPCQSTLKPAGRTDLLSLARSMTDYPDHAMIIQGYASAEEARSCSSTLSRDRVEAVARFLIANGVAFNRINTRDMGTAPPAPRVGVGRGTSSRIELVIYPR